MIKSLPQRLISNKIKYLYKNNYKYKKTQRQNKVLHNYKIQLIYPNNNQSVKWQEKDTRVHFQKISFTKPKIQI